MSKTVAEKVFDFTDSFKSTLARFDSLGQSSKIDYERAKSKQQVPPHQTPSSTNVVSKKKS